jgi:hypothetical protein
MVVLCKDHKSINRLDLNSYIWQRVEWRTIKRDD